MRVSLLGGLLMPVWVSNLPLTKGGRAVAGITGGEQSHLTCSMLLKASVSLMT